MNRRDVITLLGGAAAWPLAARAQQPTLPVIGFLSNVSPAITAIGLNDLRQGLSEAGYVQGRNVAIEIRGSNNQNDRLPELAADLVQRRMSVIVTAGVPATAAAKAATTTIPIVFLMGADPVTFGFVASLNRSGNNLTGIATFGVELGPKQLELLHELVPAVTAVALLANSANPSSGPVIREVEAAAGKLGLQLHVIQARTEREFDPAFAALRQLGAGGLVIANEGLFLARSKELAALAVRHRVPAIHTAPDFAAAGGLMSYGASTAERARLVGMYTGRILKGEKPAGLPVQQVTTLELIVNLKTAKALGLMVPQTLLVAADEVIE